MAEQSEIENSLINDILEFSRREAERFGAKLDNPFTKSYVERKNIGRDSLKDNGAYFGFIHPEEENSGPYHDFCFVVFPNDQEKPWVVSLGIGSYGFKNDYELATYPGLRRLFSTLVDDNGYCKSDFTDIETSLPKTFLSKDSIQHIRNTIKTYSKVLPVCQIVSNPASKEGKETISAFIAAYARLRDWPSNNDQRNAVRNALQPFALQTEVDDTSEILNLLVERKFVVLQGPPGTGKTRTAKLITQHLAAETFFTQFHAETSYSDFVYGLTPEVDNENLRYIERLGELARSIKYAIENPSKKVVLIIDEINRANLSNVLGPVFYLFEHKMEQSSVDIEITPKLKLNKLPQNFFTIATMNTADRSLAVVDFALRRRFAWYDLTPKPIDLESFRASDFNVFNDIFQWYASADELNLQPGQGYFIAETEEELENRIRYELFPLIKEYLQEGLLKNAKEEFNNYFYGRIKLSLNK